MCYIEMRADHPNRLTVATRQCVDELPIQKHGSYEYMVEALVFWVFFGVGFNFQLPLSSFDSFRKEGDEPVKKKGKISE